MNDNRAAFGKLINDHQDKIFHVAMGMLGNRDEALDITQEVFLKAFKSYNDFRFNSSFETWLIRITINKVKDYIRKEKLKRFLFLKPENSTEKIITMVKDNNPSPHENLEQKQIGVKLKSFQESLKGREREVFALRFGCEYSIKDISALIGIGQSSVKTYLYRALDKAKRNFKDLEKP